jgi:hypothetical protein
MSRPLSSLDEIRAAVKAHETLMLDDHPVTAYLLYHYSLKFLVEALDAGLIWTCPAKAEVRS